MFFVALGVAFVACCSRDKSNAPHVNRSFSQDVERLSSAGSLRGIIIPDGTVERGFESEGLTVYILLEIQNDKIEEFLHQPTLKMLNEEEAALRWSHPEAPAWWSPDTGEILKRFRGITPDKRALLVSVNKCEGLTGRGKVLVFLWRFNL
jgi:hypothetical protein